MTDDEKVPVTLTRAGQETYTPQGLAVFNARRSWRWPSPLRRTLRAAPHLEARGSRCLSTTPKEEPMQLQAAELRRKDGTVIRVKVPAFPDNPELVRLEQGIKTWGLTEDVYFVANSPVISYGTTALGYSEVTLYTPTDDA